VNQGRSKSISDSDRGVELHQEMGTERRRGGDQAPDLFDLGVILKRERGALVGSVPVILKDPTQGTSKTNREVREGRISRPPLSGQGTGRQIVTRKKFWHTLFEAKVGKSGRSHGEIVN